MRTILLQPDFVILEGTVARGAAVLIRDGIIVEVTTAGQQPDTAPDEVLPMRGTLLPGLVDLQVNGAGGRSVDEATPDALESTAQAVWDGGGTAFLPTLITAPFDDLVRQTAAIATWIEARSTRAATPLGIHLEGPFLESPGAHDAELFLDPTAERVDALITAARGHLRLVTLAPARQGAPAATARFRAGGVAVSIGHAHSTDQLTDCLDAGATLATHLYNAMSPLHHRDPGIAGYVLDDRRISCSMILDGAHVHDVMVRNAWRCLGPDRMVLVSDCISAMGMPDGEYQLSTIRVVLENGVVRDAAGRLAGSVLTMGAAARNFLDTIPGVGAWTVARVAATNPCRILELVDRGTIAAAQRADFTVLDADGGFSAFRAVD